MGSNGHPQAFAVYIHVNPWYAGGIHCYAPWISTDIHGYPCIMDISMVDPSSKEYPGAFPVALIVCPETAFMSFVFSCLWLRWLTE